MNKLQLFIKTLPCGFITEKDMPQLIKLDRLCLCLVRCGSARFTCPAQDVANLVKCVKAGGDYVRDVSLPVGAMDRAASWIDPDAKDEIGQPLAGYSDAPAPANVAGAASAGGALGTVARNEAHNGVEIAFTEKPSDELRSKLRLAGFRITRRPPWKWYQRYSEAAFLKACELAGVSPNAKTEQPGDVDELPAADAAGEEMTPEQEAACVHA